MADFNIVNLDGGLGNQLFQYLLGQSLEAATGRKTFYDISDFRHRNTHGGFAVDQFFAVSPRFMGAGQAPMRPLLSRSLLGKRFAGRLPKKVSCAMGIVTDAISDPLAVAMASSRGLYFRGYWQHVKYGDADLQAMPKAFPFRQDIVESVRSIEREMDTGPLAAAIQVRRKDYLTLPPDSPLYALPIDFFQRGIERLADRGIKKFYVFSDDIEMVRQTLTSRHELIFVSREMSGSAGTDLYLLSRFRNLVISNSTFGWWAAALRPHANGDVLYPNPWGNPAYRGRDTVGPGFPPHWEPVMVFPGQAS